MMDWSSSAKVICCFNDVLAAVICPSCITNFSNSSIMQLNTLLLVFMSLGGCDFFFFCGTGFDMAVISVLCDTLYELLFITMVYLQMIPGIGFQFFAFIVLIQR